MTLLEDAHAAHGATFGSVGGRRVARHYGRPERTHHAVRNGVGLTEMPYGVLVVAGDDRVDYVDNVVSNAVPREDGQGRYALLLDPQGRVETDMYVYNAGERLLLFTPPGEARPLAEEWREKVFIEDVDISVATDDFAVFGVHGPKATEKIASVLTKSASPDEHLSFVRGSMGDAGVTVVRGDGLAGEEGYDVICAADAAEEVFDTLVNRGMNAAPFGYRTWDTLTLEAGTPLFETELRNRTPAELGLSRLAGDADASSEDGERLVGLEPEALPERGDSVSLDGEDAGSVTRAADCPTRDAPLSFAVASGVEPGDEVAVGDGVGASVVDLPFVETGQRSRRIPEY